MKTTNLKNTIKAISKIVNKKNRLPILQNVQIEDNFIYAANENIFLKLALPDDSLNTGYNLNFAEFKKASEMFENINYLGNEGNKVTFEADGAKVKYNIYTLNSAFKTKEDNYTPSYRIGPDLPKLETALKFVSKDDLRPNVQHIAINNNHIISTNCHYLYFEPVFFETEANILIKPEVIKVISDIKTSNWVIYEGKEYLQFTDGQNVIWQTIEKSNYPNWQTILPQSHKTEITANRKELINEVKKAANFNSINLISLNANGSLKVQAKDEDKEYSKQLKEYSKTGEDIEIGFNSGYLNDILTEIETETINIQLTETTKAAIINHKFLLMPAKLS